MRLVILATILALTACQPAPSQLTPEGRAMVWSAIAARPQPMPYYPRPYAMPIYQPHYGY